MNKTIDNAINPDNAAHGAESLGDVRRRADLLKTGALQKAIFNSANFSSIATDADGVIQIFNVGAENMLGYAATDVVDKITPADISDPQELIARAKVLSTEFESTITPGFEALVFKASRGIEDIYELTYIRKDGSRFPAVVSVTALRDDQNAIIGYLLIGTDNTARKLAEEALVEAGALQKAIFNSANFSSIATDAKGVIQIFNVGAERMLGYTAAEMMNKFTPAHLSDSAELVARAAALSIEFGTTIMPGFEALVFKASRGIEDIYELTKIRKDGSRFPAMVSVTALRNPQDTIIGYLLIGTDNTERKRAEDARRASEERYGALFECAPDGIVIADSQSVYLDVNDSMCRMLGYKREELIGLNASDIVAEKELEYIEPALAAIQGRSGYHREWQFRRKDGSLFDADVIAAEMPDGNILGMIRDITQRKRSDQALRELNASLEIAKSEADKANLAKSDFLSSMSHELRSPLNAILGFAQLMESAVPSPTDSQTKSIAQIIQAGWYLLQLINEVLDLAVIESGSVSLSRETVSLAELMSECNSMMEPLAQQRGIRMHFPKFDHAVFVAVDRTRLKQIIINLVSNAIKYNRDEGTVTVDCLPIGPERIRISVSDTGVGLSAKKMAQLFSPFNRLGQEAGGITGTGIGLVVCKRLAELMGGVIGVESTEGIGSTFWCELASAEAPLLAALAGESALVKPHVSEDAPLRTLLYVEDNPANLQLIEELIGRFPELGMVTAVNATLGIELARTKQPQVILMDINLPGISGLKALKILREDPATSHIPVIALSANAMAREIAKGLEAGFFRYLTKPINIKEFMDTLNAAMEFAEKPIDQVPDRGTA